jgi:dTDP-4-dehydrorhamnose reductase
MTRFLVTGASGLLGLNFALQAAERHDVAAVVYRHRLNQVPFDVFSYDLSHPGQAGAMLEQTRPDVIVHCAALANLDECESNPSLARRLNTDLPAELAQEARRRGIYMLHFSTDAVFDGQKGDYREEDPALPVNLYGETKLAGEQAVRTENPDALILRVNFYGWSLFGKRSLAEWFFYNLQAGRQMKGFVDVLFCPLQVNDMIDILLGLVERRLSGLYHVFSPESLSKYQFGVNIARQFGFDEGLIQPTSWNEGNLQAVRASNLTLSSQRMAEILGHPLPGQAGGMQRFYQLYQQGYPQRVLAMATGA